MSEANATTIDTSDNVAVAALAEKDALIALMKEKTKLFVGKMKEEQETRVAAVENERDEHKEQACQLQQQNQALQLQLQLQLQQLQEREPQQQQLAEELAEAKRNLHRQQQEHQQQQQQMKQRQQQEIEQMKQQQEQTKQQQVEQDKKQQLVISKLEKNLLDQSKQLLAAEQMGVSWRSELDYALPAARKELELSQKKLEEYERDAETNALMKKKMKVYVEGLQAEQQQLSTQHAALQKVVAEVKAERDTLYEKSIVLEQQVFDLGKMQSHVDHVTTELTQCQSLLSTKIIEVDEMKDILVNSGDSAQQQLHDMQSELQDHKLKRMAARNEMINMAKTMENMQLDVKRVNQLLQYQLRPMVSTQIVGIEGLLRILEMVNSQLTTTSATTTTTTTATTILSPLSNNRNNSRIEQLQRSSASSSNSNLTDVLSRLEGLQGEFSRAAGGLTLMQSAMVRLQNNTQAYVRNDGCCSRVASLFQGMSLSSLTSSLISSRGKPSNTTGQYDRVKMDSSTTGGNLSPSTSPRSSPRPGRFTIEDDDDVIDDDVI